MKILIAITLSALALRILAQQPDVPLTLQARARMVFVDVVVADSARHSVHDLISNHIGSTEFPGNLIHNLAPLAAPPK